MLLFFFLSLFSLLPAEPDNSQDSGIGEYATTNQTNSSVPFCTSIERNV